ncbi:vesicle transport v-snare protein vti1 [Clavulina sp. PMI_390]|nr:vesicle transport v-snare protein vti1 [Clavulina sp. PMI_390]
MDNGPTSIFDSYESDFKQITSSIKAKLDGEAKEQTGEARKATLRRVDMEIEEADEIISQMQIEAGTLPSSVRSQCEARVRSSKTELSKLRGQTKELHQTASRAELMGNRTSFAASAASLDDFDNNSQRTRLLNGTQTLADSSRRLEDSHRIALETEDIGADILRNLQSQREGIIRTRDTLQEADVGISKASGTLKGMIRRMYQQRVVTGAIIAVLLLLIGIILWSKLSG